MQDQSRIVIENIAPQLNCGAVFIKRVVNEIVNVTADVLVDGHDVLQASVLYKHESEKTWSETRMQDLGNDVYSASFTTAKQGYYTYKLQGWVDYALNWQHGIERKIDDHQHVSSELLEGAELLNNIKGKLSKDEKAYLTHLKNIFKNKDSYSEAISEATSNKLKSLFIAYPEKLLTHTSKELQVYVDREKARFSTWYEFFPRSSSEIEGKHGTFKDCHRLLPRIADMGFDTLYFPPIHPIGEVNRKGKNNTTNALEGDVGSTWGIGSKHGGHKDIHPELGSLEDFKTLVSEAKSMGIEVAMDYALQAAPDHPWVTDHPDWFKWRPDGTVQYAENPPKKYQDILPIYWESKDFKNLWKECLDTLFYWIDCGVNVFRVDNPHTKPYYFWGWIIEQVKAKHPNVLFLAEAFTKPKVMHQLAKQGYTQSYTYFTWRDSKHELIEYMNELTQTDQKEYMRPNFWPNTPDINPFHLQDAPESKYIQRYALAATLSSNIGIYGPVFEQMIDTPIVGKEEYYMSEKFQLCHYDWTVENNVTGIITKVNQIRKACSSLQQTNNIKFLETGNDQLIAFYKWDGNKSDETITVISLDAHHSQTGSVQLPMHDLAIHHGQKIEVKDLITNNSYNWYNEWNYIELHPNLPFHIFKINK
ncbi:alpha-1,4-glucan--maltose-1-phosphate maltosyltransferase [Polaribacter dokdonensis]|uniref:Alpha-1,4-glucan:maltose-1-phosphate maltosyltransferase n=1 Tax=Polaribacter dokdonensis DSW-5 TaxID=1300348 RepID=A0A0N0CFR5_9FLAO|nr:alpha-1,4-glucan--maltose-1-phosphate maltosyltransferase [Polaribacter dokdonensis]KOY52197.1 Alpha-1,4-glucan:maltose-1-phosphate maltosyltransferase [Polaribacter dokdonensis DSW-5]SED93472.1 alpha-1,4-glucan:maltose-1-phosphate maltosyltransferase [Polaribacter dokdonensis DSW-5]